MEKYVGCFLVYLFLRGFFWLKSVLKNVFVCGGVKIALLLVKNVFINVKKGMSELERWVAANASTFLK